MKFVGAYHHDNESDTNILTDGFSTCRYEELPEIFASIQTLFEKNNVNKEDTVVLESDNSLAGAVVLLYLLEKGYSFFLTKDEKTLHNDNTSRPIPNFCRYSISLNSNSINPEEFLHFNANPDWSIIHQTKGSLKEREPLMYASTSGSTGKPKLVVYNHNKLLGNILCCTERLGLNSANRSALPVPISHLFGLGVGFLPNVSVQASIDLQKGANILKYLQREKEFNPDTAFMTPVFCEILVKGRRQNRPYHLTVIAGDRMKPDVFSQYENRFGCLVQLYGSTEMGALASGVRDEIFEIRSSVIGRPMPDVEMRLNYLDSNNQCGELWCRRQYGFSGWVDENHNLLDLGLIDKEGWYNTRDLGVIHSDGTIEVLGRSDHSVNRDGLIVVFADVEKALEKIRGVSSAVVISKGESLRGRGLLAYCLTETDAGIDEQTIRSACFDLLPRRAVPDKVTIIPSFPVLPNGKIDRQAVAKLADN